MTTIGAPIYVVDDDASVREAVGSLIRSAGLKVETFPSAQAFLASPWARVPSCLVLDVQLPGLSGLDLQQELAKTGAQSSIVFLTGHGDIPMSVRAMKAGAVEFLTKPLVDGDLLNAIWQGIAKDHGARLDRTPESGLESQIRTEHPFEEIVGESRALRHALQQVEIVAATDATVLVLGETGTGKELIARAIHDRSGRHARTFVKINCAAIPSGLLESELFGHERGAFTGAIAQKIGRFEVANGGTLFLDEVGEIPLELQPKLLRVVQEQEFERLGGTKTIKVDVRLVAATNRDLARMVEEQRFRDDLYYRLNVFPIQVPPLRERPEDIEALIGCFVGRFAARMKRRIEVIPNETLEAMRLYPWPGNVRELENLIERAVILSAGPRLAVPLAQLAGRRSPTAQDDGGSTLEGVERAHVVRVLEETNWLLGGPRGAAARLGMKRTTLQSLMKRLAIARPT